MSDLNAICTSVKKAIKLLLDDAKSRDYDPPVPPEAIAELDDVIEALSSPMEPKKLRVWWIPQVPMEAFYAPVQSVAEGVKILEVLALYDAFQLKNHIKPDYCNAGGLEEWVEDAGEGHPGWVGWCDEETGCDDPVEYLKDLSKGAGA